MDKRLRLDAQLLKQTGTLLISIDDDEQAHLRLLCDQVFGAANFIACLPTVMNLKGNQDQLAFAGTHEYTVVYAKQRGAAYFGQLAVDEESVTRDWVEDDRGFYKMGAELQATGVNGTRERRPNLYFTIFTNSRNEI